MNKKILALSLSFAVLGTMFAEGGVDFSGEVETFWGAGAPWTDEDNSAGHLLIGNTSFTGTLDAYYDNSSAFAEGEVSYDAVSNQIDLSLGELWLDYTSSFWGVRIGRQKTAWGKADGIDITNVICPSDMSSFAAMTSDDSKLAIDAVRLSFSGNQFTADAYWIPFFTPAALPLDEGNILRKFVVPSSMEIPIEGLSEPLELPVYIGELEKPELTLWNGEYGLKLSGYFSAFDVSLYGFYGWDDKPVLDYEMTYSTPTAEMTYALPQSITVSGEYKRMLMFGADAALPVKEIVLRLETAFFPQRYFTVSEQRNELSSLAGIDWMPSGWTLTAQYFCDVVFGELDSIDREDAYTHGGTLSVSKTLLNETLELGLSGLINFNELDSFISPSVKYSLSDQINLETGAYIFIPGPDEDGTYGQYKDLSTIYIKGKFSF